MIPNKIYTNGCTICSEKPLFEQNIEYIHKDTFYIWLKERLEKYKQSALSKENDNLSQFDAGIAAGYATVIDKLNSL